MSLISRYCRRYNRLRDAHRRLSWYLLGEAVSERAIERCDGLGRAWDRIGRLAFPMAADYLVAEHLRK